MANLKKISGYKGSAARIEAGNVEFFIVAANERDLETVYNSVLSEADPFSSDAAQKVIIISAADLPLPKTGHFIQTEILSPENEQ